MEKLPEYRHFAKLCRKLAANMAGDIGRHWKKWLPLGIASLTKAKRNPHYRGLTRPIPAVVGRSIWVRRSLHDQCRSTAGRPVGPCLYATGTTVARDRLQPAPQTTLSS
jgi:hypothetical protein